MPARLSEKHIAEEVLQDSFVNIWNNAANYAVVKSAPLTWMTAIVRNRSLDIVRRPAVMVADEDNYYALNVPDEGPTALEQLDAILANYNNTPRKCLGFLTPAETFNPLHFECESTPGSSPG